MKKLLLVALLSVAAIATVDAKVRVMPKAQVCVLGYDHVPGITPDQCKLLNDQAEGKIVPGCWVNGAHRPQLSEDQCDLIDGTWTWVRP